MKKFINYWWQYNRWNDNLKEIKILDKKSYKIIVKNFKIFIRNNYLYNKENKEHYNYNQYNQMIF